MRILLAALATYLVTAVAFADPVNVKLGSLPLDPGSLVVLPIMNRPTDTNPATQDVRGVGQNGDLLIGTGGSGFMVSPLTAGPGMEIVNTAGHIAINGPFKGSFYNATSGLAPQRPDTCIAGDEIYDIDAEIYEWCHPNLSTLWGNALGQPIP